MILLTTNPAKYEPFSTQLVALGVTLEQPRVPLIEIQAQSIEACASAKAIRAARDYEQPVLVDDAGLLLDAHPGFPGPWTAHALRTLRPDGWRALVACNAAACLVCVIAWSDGANCRMWTGTAVGWLEPSDDRGAAGPLTAWFKPSGHLLAHRAAALRALQADESRLNW